MEVMQTITKHGILSQIGPDGIAYLLNWQGGPAWLILGKGILITGKEVKLIAKRDFRFMSQEVKIKTVFPGETHERELKAIIFKKPKQVPYFER